MRALAAAVLGVLLASGAARGQEFSIVDLEGPDDVFSVAEGMAWRFEVRLSQAVNAPTSVDYTIVHFSAVDPPFPSAFLSTDDDDFDTPLTGTLSFAANQTSLPFNVRHGVDGERESNELYLVRLSSPTGGPTVAACAMPRRDLGLAEGGCSVGSIDISVRIRARDLTITITGPGSVAEGERHSYTITANPAPLVPSQNFPLYIDGPPGTAMGSFRDYRVFDSEGNQFFAENLAFPVPILRASPTTVVQIEFLRDTAEEATEAIQLRVHPVESNNGGFRNGAGLPLRVNIADASPLENPQVGITGPESAVSEGSNAVFTITVDRPISGSVTVHYAVSQIGVRPAQAADFGTGASASLPSGDITLMQGSNPSRTLNLAIFDDTLREFTPETFRVTLSNPRGQSAEIASAPYGSGAVDVSIAPSEVPSITREFSLSSSSPMVTEGDANTYTVSMSGPAPTQTLTITWTVTGEGSTFTSNPASLSFAAADGANASKNFTITPVENTTSHGPREFSVVLNEPTGSDAAHGDYAGVNSQVTTALQDDDSLRAHFSSAAVSASEGGNAQFSVRLSAVGGTTASAEDVTLSFTAASGSANVASDVTLPDPLSVTIAAGALAALTGSISISVTDDMLNEGAETFTLTISGAAGANAGVLASSATHPTTATATIAAGDPSVISAFRAPTQSAYEGDTAAFTVEVTGGRLTANAVLPYTITGTVDAADYDDVGNGRFIITPAADAAARAATDPQPILLRLRLVDDGDAGEPPETLRITLDGGAVSGGGGGGISADPGIMPHQITIPEDVPRPILRLQPAMPATHFEVDNVEFQFPVTLNNQRPGVTATVDWTVSQSHRNYLSPNSGTVTFNPGERRKIITLRIVVTNDNAARGTFMVTLRNPQPASGADRTLIAPARTSATGTILETDRTGKNFRYRLAFSPAQLNEGGATRVDLSVYQQSGAPLLFPTVDVTITMCIVHSPPANVIQRYNLGTLASAADIRVAPTSANPGGIGSVRQANNCGRLSGRSTLVDVLIPRNIIRRDSLPYVTSFMVHAVADAAAEGAETLWVVPATVSDGQAGNQFSHIQQGNDIFDAGSFFFFTPVPNTPSLITSTISANAAATRTFSLSGPATASESSGALQYTVSLSGPTLSQARAVNWEAAGSGASPVQAGDFGGALSGRFIFSTGATSRTFSLPAIVNDAVNEAAEQFTVRIAIADSDLSAERAHLTTASITATLAASDPVQVSLADAARVSEGENAQFNVSVSGGQRPGRLRVFWEVQAVATAPAVAADFRSGLHTLYPSGRVDIAPGANSAVISVPVFDDSAEETVENFSMSIRAEPADNRGLPDWPPGTITVSRATASGSIAPSDLTVTVTLAPTTNAAEGAAGGAVFELQTDNLLDSDLVVTYTLSGTASRGTDFTHPDVAPGHAAGQSYTVTRAAGDTAPTRVIFALPQDDLNEAAETIIMTLTNAEIPGAAQAAELGATTERTVTVADDDPITVRVTGNAGDVAESLSSSFTLELSGGGAYSGAVMVPWQVEATAATGDTDAVAADFDFNDDSTADSTYPSGVLSVPARSNAVLSIKIFADSDAAEPDEKFALRIYGSDRSGGTAASGGGGGAIQAQNPATLPTGTILSATNAVRVAVNLSGPSEIAEGASGSYTVTLSGTTMPVADIVVSVTVAADSDAGTADASGEDFSGGAFPTITSLTFTSSNWQTSQNFSVASVQDTTSEPAEVFVVSISATGNGTNGLSLGTTSLGTRIADDDALTISLGDASAAEGETGQLPVTISGGTPSAPLQVFFSVQGGTTQQAEYTLPQSPVQVAAAGSSMGALRIATVEDGANEASETLLLRLTGVRSPGGGAVQLGGAVETAPERNATLTITDDDPVLVTVSAVEANVPEDAGTAEFLISLGGGSRSAPLTLDWATGGDAVPGEDWTGETSGMVTIAPEGSSVTLGFAITDDTAEESDETLSLTASNPLGAVGVVSFAPAAASLRILASDIVLGPSVSIAPPVCPRGGCAEGQTVMFPVTLRNPPPVDVTVFWRVHLDDDPGTANVLLHGQRPPSARYYSDFTHDQFISSNPRDYYFGSIVFSAAEREQQKFIGIELRLDGNRTFADSLVAEAPQEFYEVRISAAPNSGENAVRVTTGRATSSIAAGPGSGIDSKEVWNVSVTAFEPNPVQEGTEVSMVLGVASTPSTRTPVPRQESVVWLCFMHSSDVFWSDIRDGRAAAGRNDFRIRQTGRVIHVDENFVYDRINNMDVRCTLVGVQMPRMVGTRVISVPIEILADGRQEPVELMWVVGFGTTSEPSHPLNNGNTSFNTLVNLGTWRAISTMDMQTARRNLFAIAASPGETRTLTLTGPASGTENGGALTYMVTPSMAFTAAATATWSVVGRGANPASVDDFTDGSGTVTFPMGSTAAQTITLTPQDDALNEPTELFTLQVAMNDRGADGGTTPASMDAALSDDDAVLLRIVDVRRAPEGGAAVFPVEVSGGARGGSLLVNWQVSGSGSPAATAADFAGGAFPSGVLALPEADMSVPLDIPIALDSLADDGEQFSVTLSMPAAPGGADLNTWTPGTITLRDDTATAEIGPYLTIFREFAVAVDDDSVAEGSAVTFTITLSGEAPESGSPATVDWALTGTAGAADISAPTMRSGTLSFTALGDQVVSVTTAADTLNEADETLILTLSNPSTGADTLPGSETVTATISDDAADAITLSVALAAGQTDRDSTRMGLQVNEGDSVSFTVTLSGGTLTGAAEIPFDVSGAAAGDFDITQPAGVAASETGAVLRVGSGSSGTITLSMSADNLSEALEEFTLELGDTPTAPGAISVSSATDADSAVWEVQASDPVTLQISTAQSSVREGNDAIFSFTLSGASAGSAAQITAPYTVSGDVTAADLSLSSLTGNSFVIPANTGVGTLRIGVLQDRMAESAENLVVTLGAAPTVAAGGGAVIRSTVTAEQSATVAIPLNAATARNFAASVDHATRTEGQTAVFSIALTGTAPEAGVPATVTWTLSGVESTDYTTPATGSGTLSFSAIGTQQVTVAIAADNLNEIAETLTLTLSSPAGGGSGGTGIDTAQASTQIAASDAATYRVVAVSPTQTTRSEASETLRARVVLSSPSESAVTIPFTIGGTATQGSDYTNGLSSNAGIFSATFAAGVVGFDVSLSLREDNINEPDETIIITPLAESHAGFSKGSGSGEITRAATHALTWTIDDDDDLVLSVSSVSSSVSEGGTAEFAVRASGASLPSGATAQLSYTLGGAGITAADLDGHSSLSGTLSITRADLDAAPAGQVALRIGITDDTAPEAAETLQVTLNGGSVAGGGGVRASGSATVQIARSDALTLSIARTDADAFEEGRSGTPGTAVFTVTATGGTPTAEVVVSFDVGGTGITSGDWRLGSASANPLRFTGSIGEIELLALADNLNEAAEQLTVTLRDPGGGGGGLTPSLGTVSAMAEIPQNEDAQVTIARSGAARVLEGSPAGFRVSISPPSAAAVTLRWTAVVVSQTNTATGDRAPNADGSAHEFSTAGGVTRSSGGVSASGMVSIPAGSSSMDFSITPAQDGREEDDELIRVMLAASPQVGAGGGAVTSSGTAEVTVPANLASVRDFAVARVGSASVSEGAAVVFRVTLSGEPHTISATVNWSVGGAAAAADWSSSTAPTLNYPVGTTSQDIRLTTVADGLNEAAEMLTVILSEAAGGGGGGTGIAMERASVEIAASDPITYAIGADLRVAEGDSGSVSAVFPVTLSGAAAGSAGGEVRLPFSVAAESTAGSGDYTLSASPLTFDSARGTQQITLMITGDVLSEAAETVVIVLGAPETGAGAGAITASRSRAVLTIVDDDNLSIRIARMSGESGDIAETGGVARFTVSVTGGTPTVDIRAPFTVAGAVSAGDYDLTMPTGIAAGAEGGVLVLPAPALSGVIALSASEDDFLEAREAFSVQLGAVSGGGGALSIASGGGSAGSAITDNESVTVSMSRVGSGAIAEGGAGLQLRLTLTGGRLSAAARIPYTLSGVEAGDIEGDSAAGLSGLAGEVVIAASESIGRTTMADFVLRAAADNLNEAAETLQVILGTPVSQGEIASAAAPGDRASVEISASDPLTLSLSAPATTPVREGGEAVFGVSLAGASLGSEGVLILSFAVVVADQQGPANTEENPDVLLVAPGGGGGGSTGSTGRASGTLTIPARSTTAQIRLLTRFDNLDEGGTPEQLRVMLTGVMPDTSRPGAGMASISATQQNAEVALENVNAARSLAVTVPPRVVEGRAITFSVGLEGEAPLTAFDVAWTLEPAGAMPPSATGAGALARNHGVAHPEDPDFSGQLSGMVRFPAGSLASQTVVVQTLQDPLNEGDEGLRLRLTPPSIEVGGRPPGFPGTAPATQVAVEVAQTLIPANDPIVLSLVRSADDPDALSNRDGFGFGVDFGCAEGTSAAAGDCVPVVPTTEVTIPFTYMVGGQSYMDSITVEPGDTAAEVNAAAGGMPIAPPQGALAAMRTVSGTQRISLALGAPSAAMPGTVPSGAGVQPQPQSGLRSGQSAAEMRTAPVRIEKQLGEFSVALDLKRAEAPEGTTLTLTATLRGSGTLTGELVIPWRATLAAPSYAPGGAPAQPEDLLGQRSGQLRFASGAGGGASQTISIEIATDTLEETGGEYFQVALLPASGADVSRLALDTTATGVLIPALRATLSVSHARAAEGEDAVFALDLSDFRGGDATTRDVEVRYRLSDGTATWGSGPAVEGADYVAPQRTGMVTLLAGEATGEIRIPLLQDGELEPRESFTLTLTSASGGGGNIIFPEMADELSATGTITDDADQSRRRAQRVGTLVGVLNRSTAVMATDAIGARLERGLRDGGGADAELSIAGRRLLGGAGGAAGRGATRRGATGGGAGDPTGAADLGLALFGAAGQGAVAPGATNTGTGTTQGAFGGLGAGLAGGANLGQRTALPTLAELLRGSHFQFRASWAGPQELAEGVEIWGSGGSSSLKGAPLQDGVRLSYDGDNHAFFLGADRPVREDLLAGVALGWAAGELDFSDRTETGRFELRGSLQNYSLGLYPYFGWRLTQNVNSWLVLGFGGGSVDMEESEEDGAVQRTLPGDVDSSMWMFSAGFSGRMELSARTELKLGFEMARVRSTVTAGRFTDGAELPRVRARSLRVGSEAELGHRFALPGGFGLRPFVSAGWRLDAGSAVEQDTGGSHGVRSMDVGGGAEADWPAFGLVLQLRGAKQLSNTGHEEQRLAVDLSYDLGGDGVGLALSLNSALSGRRSPLGISGATGASAASGGLFAGGLTSSSLASTGSRGLGGEVSYGLPLRAFGAEALLTPYATFDVSGGTRRYETGLRLLRARRLNLGLGLKLDAQPTARDAELLLTGQLNF